MEIRKRRIVEPLFTSQANDEPPKESRQSARRGSPFA